MTQSSYMDKPINECNRYELEAIIVEMARFYKEQLEAKDEIIKLLEMRKS